MEARYHYQLHTQGGQLTGHKIGVGRYALHTATTHHANELIWC